MWKHKSLVTALTLSCLAAPVLANAAATTPAIPTVGEVLAASGIEMYGHIDGTYTLLSSTGKMSSGINTRAFDFEPNSFNLQAVSLTVSKLPSDGFGGLVTTTLGKDADIIAPYGTIDTTKGTAGGANVTFDLTQAYMHYNAGALTVIAGRYMTLAGAEVIQAPTNANLSRSILFMVGPYVHTGMRATYKASDMLSVNAGVNNGWDDLKDTNINKTVELGFAFTPSPMFSLNAEIYSGVEQITNYPTVSTAQGTRNFIDMLATFNATDNLTLVLDFDLGTQENAVGSTGTAKWNVWAAYANYKINDKWRVSVRGETLSDTDGYRTGIVQTWKEASLTAAYLPSKEMEFRAEVRTDSSNISAFNQPDGSTGKTQKSFGLQALYKF